MIIVDSTSFGNESIDSFPTKVVLRNESFGSFPGDVNWK